MRGLVTGHRHTTKLPPEKLQSLLGRICWLFQGNLGSWQFFVLYDLFGMVTWPLQRLSDLQIGDKKVTAWITWLVTYVTYDLIWPDDRVLTCNSLWSSPLFGQFFVGDPRHLKSSKNCTLWGSLVRTPKAFLEDDWGFKHLLTTYLDVAGKFFSCNKHYQPQLQGSFHIRSHATFSFPGNQLYLRH